MVKLPGRGRKKETEPGTGKLLGANIALGDSRAPVSEDFLNSLGRSVYMVIDPAVVERMNRKPSLRTLIPAFSHLMRLSKIGNKTARILELDYEALLLVHEMSMNEDTYETSGMKEILALGIFSQSIVNDSFNGFKADLVTQQIRESRVTIKEEKKRGWLPF